MSVTSVKETNGRAGTRAQKGKRAYTRTFRVTSNDRNDGVQTIRAAGELPQLGDEYRTPGGERDDKSFVQSVAVREVANNGSSAWEWDATVEYAEREKLAVHPLDRPAITTFGFAQFERPMEKDFNGKAVVNSANQPFNPPVMVDDSRPTITITRNEPSFSAATAIKYQDAVNTDPFLGADAGTAKMSNISATEKYEDWNDETVHYAEVSYEIHFRREGWVREIADIGRAKRRQSPVAGESPVEDIVANGVATLDPVDLDLAGQPNPAGAERKYISFTVFKELPFAPLGLS